MDLVTPALGMLFWSVVFFSILLLILGKFAWPAIMSAIHARNESIQSALEAAEKAKAEMTKLQADNEKILQEAKAERDAMMKDAKDVKDKIIAEAKEKAGEEATKLLANARATIQSEKNSAIIEMKEQMAILSVEIAEKVVKAKLSDDKAQTELVSKLIDDIDLN